MKRFLLFSVLFFAQQMQQAVVNTPPPSSSAPPMYVQVRMNDTNSMPFFNPVTAGDLLLLSAQSVNGLGGVTVTDTLGTIFTVVAQISGVPNNEQVWAGIAPSSGADTITANNPPNNYDKFGIEEASGLTGVVDATSTVYNNGSSTNSSISITTTQTNDFIFAAIGGYSNSDVFTFGSPFTLDYQSNGNDTNAIGHYVAPTAGSYTLNVGLSSGTDGFHRPQILVAFKSH